MSTKVIVYARDNDKPGNREVVGFLNQYLRQLIQAGLRFEFKITDKTVETELAARNIDKLPAIEIHKGAQKVAFMTPVEIKSTLLKFISQKIQPTAPKRVEDDMHEFYAREMNFDKYEEELDGDDDEPQKDLAERAKEEMTRRMAAYDRKPVQRGRRKTSRRPANVREPCADCGDDPCTCEDAAPRPRKHAKEPQLEPHIIQNKPRTPQERLRAAGGDPGNKDDALLASMLETSED